MNSTLIAVTERIRSRSQETRAAYLERMHRAEGDGPTRGSLSCSNLAHGFAACGKADKSALAGGTIPNIAIVSAYNDMLSAHQPFETYPEIIKKAAAGKGAVACKGAYFKVTSGACKTQQECHELALLRCNLHPGQFQVGGLLAQCRQHRRFAEGNR